MFNDYNSILKQLDKKRLIQLERNDCGYYFRYIYDDLLNAETLFYQIATNIDIMLQDKTHKNYKLETLAKEIFDKRDELMPTINNIVTIADIDFYVKRIDNNIFEIKLNR